jgi:uncharacterized alkaline shock family protein YloU
MGFLAFGRTTDRSAGARLPGSIEARPRRRKSQPRPAAAMTDPTTTSAPPVPGTVTLSDDAVAQVVGHSVLECYGIVGMASKSLVRGVAHLLSRHSLSHGIEVRRAGDDLAIDLYVVIEYGLNLAEVAAAVRQRVTYEVERLTGLHVTSVQVHIQGVRRP